MTNAQSHIDAAANIVHAFANALSIIIIASFVLMLIHAFNRIR